MYTYVTACIHIIVYAQHTYNMFPQMQCQLTNKSEEIEVSTYMCMITIHTYSSTHTVVHIRRQRL